MDRSVTEQRIDNRAWLLAWQRWRRRCELVHQYRRMYPKFGYGYVYRDEKQNATN